MTSPPYGTIEKYTARISLMEYQERYQHIERYLGYCKQCSNYGQQWVCPPFGFDLSDYLKPFTTVDIIGYKILLDPQWAAHQFADAEEHNQMVRTIMEWARGETDPELLALEHAHPGSLACYAGSCMLCPRGACTRLEGKHCIYPDRARHSLESFGFDLGATAADLLGVPMLWSKGNSLAKYYLLVAGLLR